MPFRTVRRTLVIALFLGLAKPIVAQDNLQAAFEQRVWSTVSAKERNAPDFKKSAAYFFEENYDSTLFYAYRYLASGKGVSPLRNACRYFRGVAFLRKGLYNKAIREFDRVDASFGLPALVKQQKGNAYLELENYRKALDNFLAVEKYPEAARREIDQSQNLHNIGISYLHLEAYDRAEHYLLQSSELQAREGDTLLLIGSYIDLANLYYTQFLDEKAIPYFEKAYALSRGVKDFEIRYIAAMNMAVVEENREDLGQALEYRKEAEVWKDSLHDQNKVWDIAELEKRYQAEQNRKQVDLLEQENATKSAERNTFILASVLLLLALGAGVYFYRQKVRTNRIILAQKTELDILNATKDQLFSIVSHDLRSSVNALRTSNAQLFENLESENYTELHRMLKANGAIANGTYGLLDNLLNWAMLQTQQLYFHIDDLHLRSVVDQVAFNYLPLIEEKGMHFENRVEAAVQVRADLDSLKLILRNLLDNAIKYSNPGGTITLSSALGEDACTLSVRDEGMGMDAATRDELMKMDASLAVVAQSERFGNGLGLQLCKSMIYKNHGTFVIESEVGKGTTMHVLLPKTPQHGES